MSYYCNPFTLIDDLSRIPSRSDVYVVSEKTYNELRRSQAVDEIAVLKKRLAAYEKTAESLRETIAEIETEHGLLEASEDKSK